MAKSTGRPSPSLISLPIRNPSLIEWKSERYRSSAFSTGFMDCLPLAALSFLLPSECFLPVPPIMIPPCLT